MIDLSVALFESNWCFIVEDGTIVARGIDWLENLFDSKASKIQIGEFAFNVSASARRHIVRRAESPVPGLVPCLSYALYYLAKDWSGNELSGYDQGHFVIGFDEPDKHEAGFELNGVTLATGRETLAALNGKTLVLKTIAIGRPNPKSKLGSLLLAE